MLDLLVKNMKENGGKSNGFVYFQNKEDIFNLKFVNYWVIEFI